LGRGYGKADTMEHRTHGVDGRHGRKRGVVSIDVER
jgi:hypothetical protein